MTRNPSKPAAAKATSVTKARGVEANNTTQIGGSPDAPRLHPFLSPAQVARAHNAFLNYCRASAAHTNGAASSATAVSAAGSPSLAQHSSSTLKLDAKGVQLFLADIGVTVTESQAKDMIFNLHQSASITQKNKDIDAAWQQQQSITQQQAAGTCSSQELSLLQQTLPFNEALPNGSVAGGGSALVSSRSLSPATGKAPPVNKTVSTSFLPFELFLELLMMTYDSVDARGAARQSELQQAFQSMDLDGDGQLSERDVKMMVERLLIDNPQNRTLQTLAAMQPELLMQLIQDADLNGDGSVSMEDFVNVLSTA